MFPVEVDVYLAHVGVLAQLVQARAESGLSFRAVAAIAEVPVSSVAETESGSVWPSWQVIGGYAEAVGRHLVIRGGDYGSRFPRSRTSPKSLAGALAAQDAPTRARATHDLSCVYITRMRTSQGRTIRDLAHQVDASPATINRIDLAPQTGDWVSYLTLAAVGQALAMNSVVAAP